MSYRTRVNDVQIFGNNECYDEWIEFIKSQGIEVDDNYCYEGYIKDVDKAISVIEKIAFNIYQERPSVFDMGSLVEFWMFGNEEEGEGLLDANFDILHNSYLFMPYVFVQACGNNIVPNNSSSLDSRYHRYELAENGKVFVSAY